MFAEFDAYERFMGRWSRRLAEALVTLLEVRDGEHVLDVGTGTGVLARALVARFPGARVTGIDASAPYVEHARAATRDPRLAFRIADAQELPFPDGAFDHALSLIALNFVPDPGRAAAELRRVTRPGGVVAAAVWDYAEGMVMLRRFWDAAVALDPACAPDDEARMPLGRRGELAGLLRAAGLADVRSTSITVPQEFASFEDYWSPFLLGTGPAGARVAGLDVARREELRERLRVLVRGDEPDGPFRLEARAWVGLARVPGA